jgi:hypothetical protein
MHFKIRNALIGIVLYLYLLGTAYSLQPSLAVLVVIYCGGCMFAAQLMIAGAEKRRSVAAIEFSQTGALNVFGQEWSSFHHVFSSDKPVLNAYGHALAAALRDKIGCGVFEKIVMKDVDRQLHNPESRNFYVTHAKPTSRGTGIVLVCSFTQMGSVQGVRWWILVTGVRDPNKVFWRFALAPLTVPAVFWPYVRRRYDPLAELGTVYPGFFNAVDMLNQTRELEYVAFETLVEVLDSFDINTADLKQQKSNIMNINVTGGKASFGAVLQGAKNRVSNKLGGAAA